MKNLTMRSSMFALFTLGTALSLGCAAGPADPGGADQSVGTTEQADITPVGDAVIDGCHVSQMFDIQNSSAQSADFIAVALQNAKDMQLSLFALDSSGHLTQVNQAAQATSASMQAVINQCLQASSSLANQSAASQSQVNAASASSSLVQSAQSSVSASQSSSAAEHDDAIHIANAKNAADAKSANTNTSNAQSSAFSDFSSIAGDGLFLMPLATSLNSASAASQESALLASQHARSSSDVSTIDATHHDQEAAQQSQVDTSNSWNSAATTNSATSSQNAADQSASSLAQQATASSLFQNAESAAAQQASSLSSQDQAFTNLASQSLKSTHLLVSFTSTAQKSAANIFSGANQSVFASSVFTPVLVSCGAN